MARAKQSSNDRRITVLSGLWPRLQKLAEQDDIAVADVVNAILLQNLRPYGICAAFTAASLLPSPFDAAAQRMDTRQLSAPCQVADIDN